MIHAESLHHSYRVVAIHHGNHVVAVDRGAAATQAGHGRRHLHPLLQARLRGCRVSHQGDSGTPVVES
ncbi:MAG: hypothetical protein ACK55I_01950, partial [bacterium]